MNSFAEYAPEPNPETKKKDVVWFSLSDTMRKRNAELDARRIARTPLGRLGTVEDIARAICFLAGDDSGFVSARVMTVDGGITSTNL